MRADVTDEDPTGLFIASARLFSPYNSYPNLHCSHPSSHSYPFPSGSSSVCPALSSSSSPPPCISAPHSFHVPLAPDTSARSSYSSTGDPMSHQGSDSGTPKRVHLDRDSCNRDRDGSIYACSRYAGSWWIYTFSWRICATLSYVSVLWGFKCCCGDVVVQKRGTIQDWRTAYPGGLK